ncbi:DUF6159 family protein [Haloarchaeobius sp. HRN-SO-5]|uniref:DUF6159 family protein n=1 Tax=Haloarchaeobius sp. HRN-SO-5 TaxID=3446118 RepID=UPI003EBFD223
MRRNAGAILSNGIQPTIRTVAFLRDHPRLGWFPALGVGGSLLVWLGFFLVFRPLTRAVGVALIETVGLDPLSAFTFGLYASTLLLFSALATVVLFTNAGLVACTARLVDGEPVSIGAGVADAFRALPQLVVLAVLTGAVGLVVALLERRTERLGTVFAATVGTSYVALTFFVTPAAVLDGAPTVEMFRESASMVRSNVGDVAAVHLGVVPVVGTLFSIPLFVMQFAVAVDMAVGTKQLPALLEQHVVVLGGIPALSMWVGLVLGASLAAVAKTATYVAIVEDRSSVPVLDAEVTDVVVTSG